MVVKPIDRQPLKEFYSVDWDGRPDPDHRGGSAPGRDGCRWERNRVLGNKLPPRGVARGRAVGVVAGGAVGEFWLCA